MPGSDGKRERRVLSEQTGTEPTSPAVTDSHDTILFPVGKDKPTRCPECGCVRSLSFPSPFRYH
jgi:hypothetical protein